MEKTNELYLLFPFMFNTAIRIRSNNHLLIEQTKLYYANYTNSGKDLEDKTIIDIFFTVDDNVCIVYSSCYTTNPKTFETPWPFKLLTDVINDCISDIIYYTNNNWLILHGSALVIDGIPVILVGKSNSGKSTAILKLLHLSLYSEFISDDIIVIDNNTGDLQPWSLPLHIRTNSLVYNTKYNTTQLDDNTFYVPNLCNCVKVNNPVNAIFIISYSTQNKQHCIELQGKNKVQAILSNIKYYDASVVQKAAIASKTMLIYDLCYNSDDYLMCSLESKLNIHINRNAFNGNVCSILLRKNIIDIVTIQGESMYPVLIHNQMVHVVHKEYSDLCVGEIIVYEINRHISVHRIVGILKQKNKMLLRTKGDNNEKADDYLIDSNAYIGIVRQEDCYDK